MARRANRRTEIAHTDRVRIAGIRRCGRAALLQATALRAAFVVVLATPAAAQLPPGARPTGGTVVGGQASISQGGNTTFINQASQRAAINWQTFNVGSQQTVDFKQPNSQAIALNRVISANPSEIAGRIYANGQIVIVNQSGVVFDRGAQVDTEGLTVSAAGITNQNFMAGHMVFDQAPHPGAKITNAGTITVRQAGLAALVAPQVANSGLIQATLGRVILAGASTYTLDLYGDGLLALNVTGQVTSVQLNGQSVPALVTNQGTILANGGTVMLTASAADGLIRTLVSAGGTIAANSVGGSTGRVLAQGVGGSVEIDGEVDAAGLDAGTKGGQVVADATGDVTVGPHALVNVSGNAGGGLIALGTTAARATGGPHAASTMTAGTTTLAAGALLRADATATGQGGRVTLLSREDTNFSGAISARGGAAGGHGGWVEISAMHGMSFLGSVDAGAPLGGGLILVDPTDLEITNGTPLQGFTKMTPAQVHALTGAVLLSATDTLLLHDAVTANGAATSFELDAGISLILEANLSAPGIPVTLMGGTTGLLLQGGTVTADALTLDSQGVITESGSGAFAATSLTGSAAGAVTLQSAGNTLTTLGAFTSGDRFFLADSQALTVNAAVTAAAGFALIAPTLTVTAAGNAKGSAVLLVADKITLSGGVTATGNGLMAINRLTAGTLEIGGATPTITAADLENIVSGTLALGTINGSQVAPQTTEIDFDANVDFTGKVGTLGLFATGLVTDASGGEKVGHLYGTVGTATLTGADTVATLDHFSTTVGTLQFADSSALTIAGDVTGATGVVISAAGLSQTAGTVAATSGALTLTSSAALAIGGTLDAATVKLSATGGDITESGAVTATSLSGSASGAVTLDSASNSVATLTALAATADAVTFDDAHSLVVTGPVTAGAGVTLAVTGTGNSLGLAADLTGSDVTLTAAGSISQASGVVTANTTTIALASTGGGLSIGGTLDATTSLSLAAGGGAIVETVGGTSGAVTATSLSGSASGSVTLDSAANAFGTLAGFGGTSGALTIEDAASLLITAAINRTGAVDITITGPAHTLGLAANITGSSVTLTAPGAITQTSGVVTATATDIDLHSTAAGIAIGGTLSADAAVSLLADGGDIREKVGGNSGSVTATLALGRRRWRRAPRWHHQQRGDIDRADRQ
ncbi:MAG: filamentous hemagglutinin N-terminal domain-containing protein [Rhodospirillales bacterium]